MGHKRGGRKFTEEAEIARAKRWHQNVHFEMFQPEAGNGFVTGLTPNGTG